VIMAAARAALLIAVMFVALSPTEGTVMELAAEQGAQVNPMDNMSLGEDGDDMGESSHQERTDMREAAQDDLGEGGRKKKAAKGDFTSNVFVTAKKQKLRVGAAWNMPGLYASDGGNRDLMLGTAGGKKIYFGIARNDAYIQSQTGNMWLKGTLAVKRNARFGSRGTRLRVGSVNKLPGIYASDGRNRNLMLGTAAGKKIYLGSSRKDAWVQAGTGKMWLKGQLKCETAGVFQTLRVGSAWGMPGLYASDGGDRDMVLGTTAGKKIYFGIKKNDAWIQAGSGNMYLKGKLEVNMNSHFKAAGQTLRVGTVWGMPGLYSSDNGARDLMIGTQSGKKVYFGNDKEDAWIQAGTGKAFFKGEVRSQGLGKFSSKDQMLVAGTVLGMPGLWASEGQSRHLMLGTKSGRKIFFGSSKNDAYVEAGTGSAFFKGSIVSKQAARFEVNGNILNVGEHQGVAGISAVGPKAVMLGASPGQKVYIGATTVNPDFTITAGTGNMFVKGSIEARSNVMVYAGSNLRLRVGSFEGVPGIYSSDGAPRDLILGTKQNKKVYFGWKREDAWIQAGTGHSYFKGKMTVSSDILAGGNGHTLQAGSVENMPGIRPAVGANVDLMVFAPTKKKVYLGSKEASVESGTGNANFKGTVVAGKVEVRDDLKVSKAAVFETTVTVKKNLILATGTQTMDLAEEMNMLKTENQELKAMMAEMRSQMSELMAARR